MPTRLSIGVALFILLSTFACSRTPATRAANFLARGQRQFESGHYDRALIEFKNAAQAVPAAPEPLYRAALALLELRRPDSAVVFLRKAIALNPGHIGARVRLAALMTTSHNRQDVQHAKAELEQVLRASPNNLEALNAIAAAELKLGETADAERHLRAAIELNPKDLRAGVALAKLRMSEHDYPGAEATLKQVAAQNPSVSAARVALAEYYVSGQMWAPAEQAYRQALQVNPKDVAALIGLGGLRIRAGQLDEAEKLYRQVSLLPTIHKTLYGDLLLQRKRRDQAIHEFERLAKADPSDRDVRARLLAAYEAAGRRGDADRLLKDALTKNPKDTDALLTRGRRRLAAADYAQAEADANAVLQFLPNSAPARALLAGVHQARGETYLERQALGEVVRLDPENLTMRVRLAGLLRGSRSFRAALELMDQAPASQKRTLGWILERNWILVESEDETQLALGITEALAIGRPPDVVLQLGMLKYQQRNYAAARAAAEELLSHAPGDTLALDLLARTYVAEKQAPEALRRIHGAVAAQPTSARLQQLLGRFLLFMNRPADARNAFLAAHKLDPRSPTPVIALAEVDLQNGHLDQVRSELAPLIASPHANADARMILAEAELNSGNSESALSLYRGVADEQPDNVKALNNTAYLLVDRMHRPDEALKYAQRAVELAPGSPDFEHTLGWTLYAKRMYNMALPHLAMAAAKDPTVEHLYHLAAARFKIGDARMGFQAMEAAMKIDPRGPGADAAWAARAESR